MDEWNVKRRPHLSCISVQWILLSGQYQKRKSLIAGGRVHVADHIACNCRPVIGHLYRNGRTHRCESRSTTAECWVDHPLCPAPVLAIAIFQLVAGRSRYAAKMHYRSMRRRGGLRTKRRRVIWMNVAQMNGVACSSRRATHDNTSNDFCCCSRHRRCVEQLLLGLFVLFATTCSIQVHTLSSSFFITPYEAAQK